MKTTTLGKHNVDEGFHVLHTAYPSLQRWLDIERLELKPMDPATSLITPSSGRLQTLGDPLRAPLLMLPSLFTAGPWNALRMLRWRLKSKKNDIEYAMDHPTQSIDKGFELMRFSPSFRDLDGIFCFCGDWLSISSIDIKPKKTDLSANFQVSTA